MKWDEKVRGGGADADSIYETKESKFISEAIDKVNQELLIQKARSPFFDRFPPRNPPRSFVSAEIELDKILGTGEVSVILSTA